MLNMLKINEAIQDIGPILPLTTTLPDKEVTVMANKAISQMFQSGNLKDIPGYEGIYAASKDGRIWSYPKQRSSKNGMWLKPIKGSSTQGRIKPRYFHYVNLFRDKKRHPLQIHRLVAQTFLPNPENLPQINHKDGNSLNNDWTNIEWCDAKGNMQHANTNGLMNQYSDSLKRIRSENGKRMGAINGMKSRRMFTMAEADCIRKIHKVGKKSCRAIARVYKCSNKTISNICSYKSYITEVPQ